MSVLVVFPIKERDLSADAKPFATLAKAEAYAEEMTERYPLVLIAEDFGRDKMMRLVKAIGTEATAEWQPDEWANELLSTFGGFGTDRLVVLSESDAIAFFEALDNPREPSKSLKEIFRRHAELVRSSPEG